MAGIVQLRNDTDGRATTGASISEGKASLEALRCLKRRLSDVVYRQLVADARDRTIAVGGRHRGMAL